MKQHKWHKEIKAWADGAEIEERWISQNTEEDEWREAQTSPMWDCDGLEFRIKPQPKEPQYLYAFHTPQGLVIRNSIFFDNDNVEYIGKIKLEVEE